MIRSESRRISPTDVRPPTELSRLFGVIFFSVVTFTSAINKTSVSPPTSALANALLSVMNAVSVVFDKKTVPVASGNVIVLSAVGSALL